jgi:hypothetical protein
MEKISAVFHTIDLENFDKLYQDKHFLALLSNGYKVESTFIANLEGRAVLSALMVLDPETKTNSLLDKLLKTICFILLINTSFLFYFLFK